MKEKISVFSTHATDILLNQNNEIISQQPGGPIIFIENALKQSGVPYQLYSGTKIFVEILITPQGEFGKVPFTPPILVLPTPSTDWLIVSTLLREWDLSSLSNYVGQAFVDIQGYVRNGQDFGKKMIWSESGSIAPNIFCLKGTRQEIGFLPPDVIESQKGRLLIITDGENGLEVYDHHQKTILTPSKIIKTKDTIGAGDTFFGFFVAGVYQGLDSISSARIAMDKVITFLSSKK